MAARKPNLNAKRVAVIGAGAAGLVAVRECLREGLGVVCYESADEVGGVWDYHPEAEDDPLGLQPSKRVHGSLYANLRTNLPTELMAYRDYPFDSSGGGHNAWRQFPEHDCVQTYLLNFAEHFELYPHIRLNVSVDKIEPTGEGGWRVEASDGSNEVFEAVMICNGHYSEPRVPEMPGMDDFTGLLMHSHNYREPTPFAGQRVAVFGAGASAIDLSREIHEHAAKVYWSAQIFNDPVNLDPDETIEQRAAPMRFLNQGNIELADGSKLEGIDTFIYATGYHYRFPFLPEGIVEIDDNWIHPLYYDMLPPAHPTLCFIGIPAQIIPFPFFEMQAQWFTQRLSGRFSFASQSDMETACNEHQRRLHDDGRPMRRFHTLGDDQFAYLNQLASECGADQLPDSFESMYQRAQHNRFTYPEQYRDMPLTK